MSDLELSWEVNSLSNKNKKLIKLSVLLQAAMMVSCKTTNNMDSVSNSSIVVTSSGQIISSPESSIPNKWIDCKVIEIPELAEPVGLKELYRVGDTISFSVNNATGFSLIVTINDKVLLSDKNGMYNYTIPIESNTLIIRIKEDKVNIQPEIICYPEEYREKVSVSYDNKSLTPNSSVTFTFSKDTAYSIEKVLLNGVKIKLNNDSYFYIIPEEERKLKLEIYLIKEPDIISLNIDSNEPLSKNYTISGNKKTYTVNEKAVINVKPDDFYMIEKVLLNGEILSPSKTTTDLGNTYEFIITATSSSESTFYIYTKPKKPIIRGKVSIIEKEGDTLGSTLDSSRRIPGLHLKLIDTTINSVICDKINIDFDNGGSFISYVNEYNNNYYSDHLYSLELYKPEGDTYEFVYSLNGITLDYDDSKYVISFIIPFIEGKKVDLSYIGEKSLPNVPLTVEKNERTKTIDDGNQVMLYEKRNSITVITTLKYDGRIVDDNDEVIKTFSSTPSKIDFKFSMILEDFLKKQSDYTITIHHDKELSKYIVNQYLPDNQTADSDVDDIYIKALKEGTLQFIFNRTYNPNETLAYTYNGALAIKNTSYRFNLPTMRSKKSVTYIGSRFETDNTFTDDVNKGSFTVLEYKVNCQD